MAPKTTVILDRSPGPLPPYPKWLDGGADVALFTSRSAKEIAAHDTSGYVEVRCFADYATSTGVELGVLELAARTELSAIVATGNADLVRAGALRDHLGLRGQGRADAIVFSDPVAMRQRLEQHGIATIPCGPVTRPADLYWYAHRWGFPLRVRQRSTSGWPVAAVLRGRAEVRAFITGTFTSDLRSVPSLMVEPWISGARHRARLQVGADGSARHSEQLRTVVVAALSALPTVSGYSYLTEVNHANTGEWLVDTVSCDALTTEAHRDAVRIQAGLVPNSRELTSS